MAKAEMRFRARLNRGERQLRGCGMDFEAEIEKLRAKAKTVGQADPESSGARSHKSTVALTTAIGAGANQPESSGGERSRKSTVALNTTIAAGANQAVQMPLWADDKRGVPNDLVRSSLFTVGQSRTRRFLQNEQLATIGQLRIYQTGQELRQREEDVFLQLLHYQRMVPVGQPVAFRAADMITALGMTKNSASYTALEESVNRLKGCTLVLTAKDKYSERGFSGNLIRRFEYERDLETGRMREWKVTFEPEIVGLFSHISYSSIYWEQRMGLSPIAKWLHSFYVTHAEPFAYSVKLIHKLCGSQNRNIGSFRNLLLKALDELVAVGFLESGELDDKDKVVVRRVQQNKLLGR